MINLEVPITKDISNLKVGDVVYLSGTILTARDQAHKRIIEEESPYNLEGAAIFHAGPIIKNNGTEKTPDYEMVVIGPTTSTRMNPYQADVIDKGVKIVIGKGGMDDSVAEALKRNNALYLVATGGCAALYAECIKNIDDVKWLDLGMPEAIWNLKVDSFGPLIVGMDSNGNNIFK